MRKTTKLLIVSVVATGLLTGCDGKINDVTTLYGAAYTERKVESNTDETIELDSTSENTEELNPQPALYGPAY